jgi:hypothetical protein
MKHRPVSTLEVRSFDHQEVEFCKPLRSTAKKLWIYCVRNIRKKLYACLNILQIETIHFFGVSFTIYPRFLLQRITVYSSIVYETLPYETSWWSKDRALVFYVPTFLLLFFKNESCTGDEMMNRFVLNTVVVPCRYRNKQHIAELFYRLNLFLIALLKKEKSSF